MFLMNEKNYYPESMKVYEIFNWTNEFILTLTWSVLLNWQTNSSLIQKARLKPSPLDTHQFSRQ